MILMFKRLSFVFSLIFILSFTSCALAIENAPKTWKFNDRCYSLTLTPTTIEAHVWSSNENYSFVTITVGNGEISLPSALTRSFSWDGTKRVLRFPLNSKQFDVVLCYSPYSHLGLVSNASEKLVFTYYNHNSNIVAQEQLTIFIEKNEFILDMKSLVV